MVERNNLRTLHNANGTIVLTEVVCDHSLWVTAVR
jgi:hypothetical protein